MTGYSPCIPCAKGFYQPDIGQMTCLKCNQLSNVSECVSGKSFFLFFFCLITAIFLEIFLKNDKLIINNSSLTVEIVTSRTIVSLQCEFRPVGRQDCE